MTSTRPLFQTFAAITLLMTLANCTLPVGNTLVPTTSKTTTIGAGQARLVFQVGEARSASRALTDAGYLTLEMRSVADGTVKADDATREADGSYLIDIAGLVAGDWRLKVRLYSDSLSPSLLYYADLTHYVGVGAPTTIALKVYEPSSLASGTISLADKVESLDVEGRGQPWGTSLAPSSLQMFRPGEVVQIHAIPMSTSVPATDARVTYLSDDTDVVEISATGRLKARGIGETTLHITTVEGRKTANIPVKVEETIVGVWEYGSPLSRILKVERSPSGELWATLMTNLQTGAMEADVVRGRVTKQLDGTYKANLGQKLGFVPVGADFDRTQRVFSPDFMASTATFSEQGSGILSVMAGNMMTSVNYTRLNHYVPVNRFDNQDPTAYTEPTTHDGWTVDPGRWNIENDTAGEPETYSQLYWWVEDTNLAFVDSKTGALTLTNPGSTKIHVQSLDNPSLPALSWNLTVEGVAPSYTLANFDIGIPADYTNSGNTGEYQKLDFKLQVAYDPAVYDTLYLQSWNGSSWVTIVPLSLVGTTQGLWYSTSYIDTTFSTERRFRVITKGSTTSGFAIDSEPSADLVVMSPDSNGNPVIWPGSNTSPDGSTFLYNDGTTYQVPVFDGGTELYRSRWFTSADGSTWNPNLMYSLRWGTRTWWIYSDSVYGSSPGAYIVGRDHLGNPVGTPIWRTVPQVYNIGLTAGGDANLFGSGTSSGTIYWDSSSNEYQDGAP